MSNKALKKKILEASILRPEEATNGNSSNYDGHNGFTYFDIPGTLTLDLGNIEPIKCIRFLLWDGLGIKNGKLDRRIYNYRLSVSLDNSEWLEIHQQKEAKSWQVFKFNKPIRLRYIRLYGLGNSVNEQFHVVELEAYDNVPDAPLGNIGIDKYVDLPFDEDVILYKKVENQPRIDSKELEEIVKNLEETGVINPDLIQTIKARFEDLIVLDQNIEAIRNEIVNPVSQEIQRSNRFAITALVITIIGLILTIVFSPQFSSLINFISELI